MKSPEHEASGVGIEALGRHGNANSMLVGGDRLEIEKDGEAQEASAATGVGHAVEASPGEQVMAAAGTAADGGSLGTTAVG